MTLRCPGIAVELALRRLTQEMHTRDRTSEVTGLQARRGRKNGSKRIRINRLQAQTVLDTDYISVVLYGEAMMRIGFCFTPVSGWGPVPQPLLIIAKKRLSGFPALLLRR